MLNTVSSKAGMHARDTAAAAVPRFLRPELLRPMIAKPAPSLEIITDMAGLRALKEEWQALEKRCISTICAYQTYDWCAAWAEVFMGKKNGPRLFILALRRRGHLQVLWPLMITGGTVKVLRWLSDPYAQYGDVLIDPQADLDDAVGRAWQTLKDKSGADIIKLRHVPDQAASFAFLQQHCREAKAARQSAPFMDLSSFRDEKAYEGRYSRAQRRRRRKIKIAFEKLGEMRFGQAPVMREIDALLSEKRIWMQQHGYRSKVLESDRFGEFMHRLCLSCDGTLTPHASVMLLNGKPVSWELAFRFKDRHLAFLTAHDHRHHLLSPARLHMDLAQRQGLKQGIKTYDLMVPGDPHKASFANNSQNVHCLYAPVTTTGWLYGKLHLEWAWPAARRLYYFLPNRLRKAVTYWA